MKRTNFYLANKQIDNLKSFSQETDLSVSEHVRRAVDLYLEGMIKERNKSKMNKKDNK